MEKQKKGLSAFLKKQKQKTAGSKGTDQPDASPEKEQVDLDAAKAQEEAAQQKEQEAAQDAKAKGNDSSDESDDDLTTNVRYGKVQEKEEASAAQAEAEAKATKDFADLELESKAKDEEPKQKAAKKNAGQITFGTGVRPSFGNRAKASAIMKDDGGLDDLDDGPKGKKAQKEETLRKEQQAKNAEKNVVEETKGPTRPVRPTFRGKLNLAAGGDSEGVKTAYGYSNTYKTEKDEEEKTVEGGRKDRKPKAQTYNITGGNKGGDFRAVQADLNEHATAVDEDGFEIVGAVNDRKTRRQLAQQQREPVDDGFKIVRNEKRGGAFDAMRM